MFKLPDWCYRQLPSSHKIWITLWITWFVTLWFLSSGKPSIQNGPNIPNIDKVLHFGYYMIGGFFFANFLHLNSATPWNWRRIITTSLIIGALVGGLDEYRQSFTPGRSGNDLGDWIADISGTLTGAYYCYFMWIRINKNPLVKQ